MSATASETAVNLTFPGSSLDMANLVKSYFLPPTWRYKPSGPIFLGSVVADPKAPQDSLSLRPADDQLVLTLDDEQDNFTAIIDASKQLEAGIDASLLSIFGAGGGFSVKRSKKLTYRLRASQLRTQEISPKPGFINDAMQNSDVEMFLKGTKYREDVYMIVGLMIGSGVSIRSDEGHGKGFSVNLTVDARTAGVPLQVGPKFSKASDTSLAAGFDATSRLVLGYRLRRISYVRKTRYFTSSPHEQGAVLGDGQDGSIAEAEPYAEILGLDEDDIGAEEFHMPSIDVIGSSGTLFTFVVPKSSDSEVGGQSNT